MQLTSPTYLWWLSALLIPIAIHLWSRRSFETINWPLIKFIAESSSRKAATIKWEDTPLFMVRALIFITLVFILADPIIKSTTVPKKNNLVLIDPLLMEEPTFKKVLDTLAGHDNSFVLKAGFPSINNVTGNDVVKDSVRLSHWSMLKLLPASEISGVTIFSTAHYKDIDGIRPTLPFPVNWYPWPVYDLENKFIIQNLRQQIWGIANTEVIRFENSGIRGDSSVAIHYSLDISNEKAPFIRDGIFALMELVNEKVTVIESGLPAADIIFTDKDRKQKATIVKLDTAYNQIRPLIKRGNYYLLNPISLKVESMIDDNLVVGFFDILISEGLIPDGDWEQYDIREIPLSQLQINEEIAVTEKSSINIYLSTYLWYLLILLIIIERLMVMKRAA